MKIDKWYSPCPFLAVLLVSTVLMVSNKAHAGEINGKVIAVDGKQVTIKIGPDDVPSIGDQVELSFMLADEKFMVGTWQVLKVEGTTVFAEAVKVELPADVGMTATIAAVSAEELFRLKPKGRADRETVPATEQPAAPSTLEARSFTANIPAHPVRGTIQHTTTRKYEMIWKDSGSGARKDFATFRPKGPPGYYPLGDVAVAEPWRGKRYAMPEFNTVMVRSDQIELKKPERYRKIWDSAGSHSDRPFSSWEPVAPTGYRCLGDVGSQSLDTPPATDTIRCLPDYCVQETELGERIWKDKGSGATIDFSAWRVPQLNLYIGTPAHARPRGVIYTINPDCLGKG